MRLFVTTNGPGEVMGWVRPFLRAVYEREPEARVTAIVLPCAYATGRECEMLTQLFPALRVIDPASYGRFLLGRRVPGLERTSGFLQYLGGDLFHAKTVARRLGLHALTYKFTKRSYATLFERFFAVDEANAAQLRALGAAPDRVRVVGNLVVDGVVGSLEVPPPPPGTGEGVAIMVGSRPYELRFLMPFFLAVARELVRLRPQTVVTFLISPFNTEEEVHAAVGWRSDPVFHGLAGRYLPAEHAIEVEGCRFGVDRSETYAVLARSRLVVTIPGTKCLEAAILGRAMLVVVPTNRLDEIAVNGPAAYLHRVPLVGVPLKRWLLRRLEKRIRFFAQPNIDAGREIVPEVRGILHPHDVAARAAALLDDAHACRIMAESAAALYASHVGAAGRMADEIVMLARRDRARLAG
jgi:hypothetical protein